MPAGCTVQALAEMQRLIEHIEADTGEMEVFTGLGLSSRKNLCVHPAVSLHRYGKEVDSECRKLTASFIRANDPDGK
jgi:DNA excision repair protein ERCC-2